MIKLYQETIRRSITNLIKYFKPYKVVPGCLAANNRQYVVETGGQRTGNI